VDLVRPILQFVQDHVVSLCCSFPYSSCFLPPSFPSFLLRLVSGVWPSISFTASFFLSRALPLLMRSEQQQPATTKTAKNNNKPTTTRDEIVEIVLHRTIRVHKPFVVSFLPVSHLGFLNSLLLSIELNGTEPKKRINHLCLFFHALLLSLSCVSVLPPQYFQFNVQNASLQSLTLKLLQLTPAQADRVHLSLPSNSLSLSLSLSLFFSLD